MAPQQSNKAISEANMLQPSRVRQAMPMSEEVRRGVEQSREAVSTVLASTQPSGRLMVVVGPCSVHDPEAAVEYATRLAAFAKKHERQLLVVMRVYVEKPRSTVGWKGLVHHADYAETLGSSAPDMNKGVVASRSIMLKVARMGLPIACELLNPLLVPFFQDLVSLGVIGARTTESQTHREMSSDMPMPMGFKNGTDGGLRVAIDAMTSASRSHTVVGVDDDGKLSYRMSRGNPDTFIILRGGSKGPNFAAEHVQAAERELLKSGKAPGIVVDCSHGNSNKDYRNQGGVCDDLAAQLLTGAAIVGVMLESNINEGRQDVKPQQTLQYGVSITDACVGWCETERILTRLSDAVRQRQTNGIMPLSNTLEIDAGKLGVDIRAPAIAI